MVPFSLPNMLVIIASDYDDVSQKSGRIVAAAVGRKPNLTLGLAAGSTLLGMYQQLIRFHREERLDFSRVITFNLDEYIGLLQDHLQSYHYFMHRNFFDHINIKPSNVHIPEGKPRDDYEAYCEQYEESIQRTGGIDLQVLGIGKNGHIGFNEPGSSFASRTRPRALTQETLRDNKRLFRSNEEVPEYAITMGIGTILDARRILLLASGASKAQAVAKGIEGPITATVPASALQLHRDATLILDEEAATELANKDYYKHVLDMTVKLTPGRLW